MSLDECIGFLAAYGCSKHSVAKILDIRWDSFLDMCKAMPHVEWASRGYTIADKQARRKTKGKFSPAKQRSIKKAIRSHHVRAFGIRATIKDHTARCGVVTYRAVLKRMSSGMSLEDALITPDMRKAVNN